MTEIELLLMEKLAAKETPADTDTMIVAEGNKLKKSTIAQLVTFLKEKLGINSLNSKLNGWKVENYKLEVNSSTGYIGVNKDISLSGYKPVCIANYWLYNTSWYAINKIWIDYATQKLSVAGRHINNSQSDEYVIIFVQILYVPV
ncbi:hypothetical protein H8Z79_13970 [Blautia sp. 2744]|uniref:Uncharacterized protein n=1 Tax=Blautia intestinalis TaxID=2763028 RepID=A0ABR7I4U1_9FIRM|nr:hypothetical protein [Blautia intestinalis]MBC5741522.1 hypothetical protein [Blautia intestinalis]RHD30485.1 hypothetical protein DW799_12150 [Blautia obeum]